MVCYEDLEKFYGDYPKFEEKDLQEFLESDDLYWFIAYIRDEFLYVTESGFCEAYYSRPYLPRMHWKNVISFMSGLTTFKLFYTDEFTGEKQYVNTKLAK